MEKQDLRHLPNCALTIEVMRDPGLHFIRRDREALKEALDDYFIYTQHQLIDLWETLDGE